MSDYMFGIRECPASFGEFGELFCEDWWPGASEAAHTAKVNGRRNYGILSAGIPKRGETWET